MNVRTIELTNVFGHAKSEVALPERGVVIVTGANGAGKSGLFLEGVALGLWGKTLRGAPGWDGASDHGHTDSVRVTLPGLVVKRTRKGAKTSLDWTYVDDGTEEGKAYGSTVRLGGRMPGAKPGKTFETPTKAQDALEALIGPFDVWRRTRAFSSSDAAHFSTSTDSERKRLLETVLGIERFDVALEKCRADIRTEEKALSGYHVEVARAKQQHATRREELVRAQQELAKLSAAPQPEKLAKPAAPAGRAAQDLRALAASAGLEVSAAREKLRVLERQAGAADGEARVSRQLIARLAGTDTCPQCLQPVTPEHVAEMQQQADNAGRRAAQAHHNTAAAIATAQAELAELEAEKTALDLQAATAREAEHTYTLDCSKWLDRENECARWGAQLTALDARIAEIENLVEQAAVESDAAEYDIDKTEKELAILRSVETVLGLRGVRAQLLGRALIGIEAVANTWLSRLGRPGLSVSLLPYSEKKTGGVADSISINIAGAGAGHGYKGASTGERRRIDLALLLGLAEIASASAGARPGTLFFDELLDGLDSDGAAAASSALEELAQDRCVVVISHNEELVRHIRAARRYHVEQGMVLNEAQRAVQLLGGKPAAASSVKKAI